MIARPDVVSAQEWQLARDELLVAEKASTRSVDALAARRRRLPMVKFDVDKYVFDTPSGPKSLLDFFDGRQQLAAYQFMDRGPDVFCPGCTHFTNNVTALATLADCGVSWVTISNMPLDQLVGYAEKKGWDVSLASSAGTSFTDDTGSGDGFMLNMFMADEQEVFRTYSTTARGADRLLFVNNILDLAPFGRQEDWEDSPAGWPQGPTYG